jgi:hypothetical protein
MLVCFRFSMETKRLLDELVQSGGYRNHGEVVQIAVANLALLEREVSRKGVIIGDRPESSGAHVASNREINWEGNC